MTCISDISGDFKVNGADLGLLNGAWCESGCTQNQLDDGDLNCDGKVNGDDLGILLGAWTDQELCTISPICTCTGSGESAQGGESQGAESQAFTLEEALAAAGFDSPEEFLAWSAEADPEAVSATALMLSILLNQ